MTSATPRSIWVFSGQYHIMSNASIVSNCIMSVTGKIGTECYCVMSVTGKIGTECYCLMSVTLALVTNDSQVHYRAITVTVTMIFGSQKNQAHCEYICIHFNHDIDNFQFITVINKYLKSHNKFAYFFVKT